jgi:hypothetical protein
VGPDRVRPVAALPVNSCVIDGEAIVSDPTGLAVFSSIRSYRNGPRAMLCAFDLIDIDGEDLRWRRIEDRKGGFADSGENQRLFYCPIHCADFQIVARQLPMTRAAIALL